MKRARILAPFALAAAVLLLAGCFPGGGQQQQKAKIDPVFSPDGTQIVFVATHDGDPELYIANADGTEVTKLTDNQSVDASPRWAPDGSRIVFVSDRDGDFSIYTMRPDGTDTQLLELRLPGEASAGPGGGTDTGSNPAGSGSESSGGESVGVSGTED